MYRGSVTGSGPGSRGRFEEPQMKYDITDGSMADRSSELTEGDKNGTERGLRRPRQVGQKLTMNLGNGVMALK